MNLGAKTIDPAIVKQLALQVGFDACGISKAEFLEEEAPRLENWLHQNMHGEMGYMANHFDKRLDPRKLVPGSKSVISLVLNYYPSVEQEKDRPKISKYAYGRDYHKVFKKKCRELTTLLTAQFGDFDGRVFVDSAPVMDKVWAAKSGIGWIGKHSNLINRNMGSFFFIAEIISDLNIAPDSPIADYCGTCTKCIDACPTDAIAEPYVVDGSKCISYFTIELKDAIPEGFKGQFEDWIFGCDICQDVCPWNRFSKPHQTPDFEPKPERLGMSWDEWEEITKEVFNEAFAGTPLKRAKYEGLKRNVQFAKPRA